MAQHHVQVRPTDRAPKHTATALVSRGARWRPRGQGFARTYNDGMGGVPGGGAEWTWGLWDGAAPLRAHPLLPTALWGRCHSSSLYNQGN